MKRADFAKLLAEAGLTVADLSPLNPVLRLWAGVDRRLEARKVVIREGLKLELRASELGQILQVPADTVRRLARDHQLGAFKASAGAPHKTTGRVRKLRLVVDNRDGDFSRRNGDCAELAACEVTWIEVHGGAQAACPGACRFYEQIHVME